MNAALRHGNPVRHVQVDRPLDRNIMIGVTTPPATFREPTAVEKFFNRSLGYLVSLGIGPVHIHLLEVRGRKSGKIYCTPVDLLEFDGKQYLVAPRGRTQWVRNAEVSGEIILRRGRKGQKFGLRAMGETEKLPILKSYLDSFRREAQRYFPVTAGSPPEAFAEIASSYPAFELSPR